MADIYSQYSTRYTPQTEQADPRQEPNHAGGYTFTISDQDHLFRFLLLGSTDGTYYQSPMELTRDNAGLVIDIAGRNHKLLRDTIETISVAGRAPRQRAIIFALAIACSIGTDVEKRTALGLVPVVCRTGTHLFLFAGYVQQFRGWGRGLRRAIADWYTGKPADRLAYQLVKYRQRGGWSHRDLLRLSHPTAPTARHAALFEWVSRGTMSEELPELVDVFERARTIPAGKDGALASMVDLIRGTTGLSWEMLPTSALTDPGVWEALLDAGMPVGALIRQLPRLTNLGVITDKLSYGRRTSLVVNQISDQERLRKARVHPLNLLVAQNTYASGRGASTQWSPVPAITDALDRGFYASFGAVPETGKRTLIGLDVSASMSWYPIVPGTRLTSRDISAALCLVQVATEPGTTQVVAFSHEMVPVNISPRQRLDDVLRTIDRIPMGGTDCAQPILHALTHGLEVDTFIIYTDNESWSGSVHVHEALRQYRAKTGIPAKLIAVGLTATRFSVADPDDPLSLNIAGFDAALPQIIASFSTGTVS